MAKKAVYPGTFDPITLGHIDVISRAAEMFDEVILLIAVNSKKQTLFSEEERLELAAESIKDIPNARAVITHGLTVDSAREHGAVVIIRGVRAVSDFDYEFQIALMNRKLMPEIHTVFLLPHEKYTYLNSSIIRELARYGQDVSDFVPQNVSDMLTKKFNKMK